MPWKQAGGVAGRNWVWTSFLWNRAHKRKSKLNRNSVYRDRSPTGTIQAPRAKRQQAHSKHRPRTADREPKYSFSGKSVSGQVLSKVNNYIEANRKECSRVHITKKCQDAPAIIKTRLSNNASVFVPLHTAAPHGMMASVSPTANSFPSAQRDSHWEFQVTSLWQLKISVPLFAHCIMGII